MKILYRITKILLVLLIILYVFVLIVGSAMSAFCVNEGAGSWRSFGIDLLNNLFFGTPLAGIIFIPFLALRSFLAYKLDYTDKRTLLNRMYVMLALEILFIIIFSVLILIALNL